MKKIKLLGAFIVTAATGLVAHADGSRTFDNMRGESQASDLDVGYVYIKCNPKAEDYAIIYTGPNGKKYFMPRDRTHGIWFEVASIAPSTLDEILQTIFLNEGVKGALFNLTS